jgi:Amt family ammonium transporter
MTVARASGVNLTRPAWILVLLAGFCFCAQAQTSNTNNIPVAEPVSTAAALQALQGQNADLQSKLNQLNGSLNDQNTRMAALQDQIQKTQQITSTKLQDIQTSTDKKYNDVQSATDLSINISWTLITGFLVMFMQAGFALVETGFTRAKNVAHTMMMNFMVYGIAMLGFWVCGFAFQFGATGAATSCSTVSSLGDTVKNVLNSQIGFSIGDKYFGLLGNSGYFLYGASFDAGIFTLFLFQMVFMDTAATIPTGAMAERWRFLPFCLFSFCVGAFIYPIFGSWVWGGGWLACLGKNFGLGHGHVDFAGSSVVHMVGGVMALAGAKYLGPRIGKYNADGTPNPIPGHNIPMAILGTFILAFGWFGFNPGSTLASTDTQIGIIATNTMLASAAGAAAAMIVAWIRIGKPDPSFACNGMLAGLVAITAPCAFVDAWAAVLLGAIAGVIMYFSVFFVEEVLKIDDPVGAISVHGTCGFWGVLSLGIFANGKYGDGWNGVAGTVKGVISGDPMQLVAEFIGGTTNFIYVFGITWAVLWVLDKALGGHRVSAETETQGLDIPEMGAFGYNTDV